MRKGYNNKFRLFSVLQLKGLKRRSARCEQTIRYECSNAPLEYVFIRMSQTQQKSRFLLIRQISNN